MRRHPHGRLVDLLRQPKELLAQGLRRLQLGPRMRIIPEPPEGREQVVRRVEVVTELPRPRVGLGHLRISLTFSGTQRCPEGSQQSHFTLAALTALGARGEQPLALAGERAYLVGRMRPV